jgi:hypothetical protein
MRISPEFLSYEEHILSGSTLPAPNDPSDFYTVQKKLLLPRSHTRSISRRRILVGSLPLTLISAVFDFGELNMNLELLDHAGRTIRSPRIIDTDGRNLTTRIYRKLLEHPVFGRIYTPILRMP